MSLKLQPVDLHIANVMREAEANLKEAVFWLRLAHSSLHTMDPHNTVPKRLIIQALEATHVAEWQTRGARMPSLPRDDIH